MLILNTLLLASKVKIEALHRSYMCTGSYMCFILFDYVFNRNSRLGFVNVSLATHFIRKFCLVINFVMRSRIGEGS
jgi:hypothetical protein